MKAKAFWDLTVSIVTRPAAQIVAEPGGSRTRKGMCLTLGLPHVLVRPAQRPGLPSHSLTFTAVKENTITERVRPKEKREQGGHRKK